MRRSGFRVLFSWREHGPVYSKRPDNEILVGAVGQNALATNAKIRQAVSGFDLKMFVSGVLTERAVPIIDADLRDERENKSTLEVIH